MTLNRFKNILALLYNANHNSLSLQKYVHSVLLYLAAKQNTRTLRFTMPIWQYTSMYKNT